MAKFQPNSDRVLVKKNEFKSQAGLVLAGTVEMDIPYLATIVECGPGKVDSMGEYIELPWKTGDVVLIDNIGGLKITHDGEEYRLVRSEEILGTIINEPAAPTLNVVK